MKADDASEKLIHELLDGTITREDAKRLEQILLRDPAARRAYCDLTSTDQLMMDCFSSADAPALYARQSAVEGGWSEKRRRGHPWKFSFASAAAILLIGLTVLVMIRLKAPEIRFAVSSDGRVLVDGSIPAESGWRPSQKLSLEQGVMTVRLNPATELCVESPAEVVLLDSSGSFELESGRAWVRTGPGAPDFRTRVRGGSIRHIGTRFGVVAGADGRGEVHVGEGAVELERGDAKPLALAAGEAVAWTAGDKSAPLPVTLAGFQQSLPAEFTLFSDNFNEAAGTPLSRKMPDVGGPWMVLREKIPTRVGGGKLDTSGGYRSLGAQFQPLSSQGKRMVFLVSLSTAQPERLSDKTSRRNGSEGVLLWDSRGTPVFSLVARAADGHRWRLRDEVSKRESEPIEFSALEANELTLRYDPARDQLAVYGGGSVQSELLAELRVSTDHPPVSLTVENDDGGDLALHRIDVRAVAYPGDPDAP